MNSFKNSGSGAGSSSSSSNKGSTKSGTKKRQVGIHKSGKLAKKRNFQGQYTKRTYGFFCTRKDCPKKDTPYSSSTAVIRHIDRDHHNRTWTCKDCLMVFGSQPNYLAHVKSHTNPADFECSVCQMTFSIIKDKDFEKVPSHQKNVEDLGDEEKYYTTHPPADSLDLNDQGTEVDEFDPINVPSFEVHGHMVQPDFLRKVDDVNDGDEVGTSGCKREGKRPCYGIYHRIFSGNSGRFVRVNGRRIRVRGHHDCKTKNFVYLTRDRKSKRFYFGQTTKISASRFQTYSFMIRFVSQLRRQHEKAVLKRYFNDSGDQYEYQAWIDKMNSEYVHWRNGHFDKSKLRCPFYISKVVAHFASPGRTYRDILVDILVSFKDSTPLVLVERNCIDGMTANYGDGLNDPKAQQWEKLDHTMMKEYLNQEDEETSDMEEN